jgi:3-oxoadipate enol-lactonase
MPKIDVNGETLAFHRAGKGPPLLLIHSLGTGAWMWAGEIAHFSDRFEVIAFDARGHGASTHNGPVTIQNIAADLVAALKALGVGPAHVIAISMGGPIAALMYSKAPEAFASLVIADSFARQGEAGAARVKGLEETLAKVSMHDYATAYAQGTLHRNAPAPHMEALVAGVAGMSRETYLEIARTVFTADVAALMAQIAVPVRVVVGAQDTRTPPAMSEEIARLVPGADLKVIPEAAHLANLDNPEGFHAAIEPFLARQVEKIA